MLVVGCGLRATGLLTSTPALFDYDVGIIDARTELSVGSFRDYDIESNSNGSDFFGWIDPAGPFGPVLDADPVRRLRATPTGFHLGMLADALVSAGHAIRDMLAPERLLLGDEVVQVSMAGGVDDSAPVSVRTAAGRTLRARTVVLAAGIRERPVAELEAWSHKVVASRALFGPQQRERCVSLGHDRVDVCFAGASHSAFSVLARMLTKRTGSMSQVVMVGRSPVRVFYESWAEYARIEHTDAEAAPDPERDICPETGNVHRYSGLRNTSKALFHAVAGGRVPGVRLVVAPDAQQRRPYFEQADVLIQAAGYGSNLPRITAAGHDLRAVLSAGAVQFDEQGRLRTDAGVARSLFVMGMDPYPYDDNSINPSNQYARRGGHLLDHLSALCREAPGAMAGRR